MADGAGGEKTEAPTQKKLKDARKEGQIGRSTDVGAWAGVLGCAAVLPLVIDRGKGVAMDLLTSVNDIAADPDPVVATALLGHGLRDGAVAMLPLGGVAVVIALASAAAQGGVHLATKAARPKLNRLSPKAGLKRVLGPHALWEAAKAVLKTAVLAFVLWTVVKGMVPVLVGSGSLPLMTTVDAARSGTVDLIRTAVIAGLVVAAADFVVIKRRTNKQLRMSKKEVMDEHKQSEGDPQLKGQMRSRQLAMSRNRMMSEIASADVILVNPTHVAVALRYDPDKGAPRVVAKGAGTIAATMRARATEARVPMVEDVPLARALYAACELGQEVPSDLFLAVARVLAFVMRLRSGGAAAGMHRMAS